MDPVPIVSGFPNGYRSRFLSHHALRVRTRSVHDSKSRIPTSIWHMIIWDIIITPPRVVGFLDLKCDGNKIFIPYTPPLFRLVSNEAFEPSGLLVTNPGGIMTGSFRLVGIKICSTARKSIRLKSWDLVQLIFSWPFESPICINSPFWVALMVTHTFLKP